MRVQWYGQSAFSLATADTTVMIDPFGDLSAALASRGGSFDYPAIDGVQADLLLVTHEHGDHNAVELIGGDPVVLRSTAGRLDSPIGEIVAIASEHDDQAGTARGPNTIFVFDLEGLRVCHFGDFGQSELRDEQAAAIGAIDLLFIPVGDGPTIGGTAASAIVERLGPRWAVPMHYRTPRISFLDTEATFVELAGEVERTPTSSFATGDLAVGDTPRVVVPAVP